MQIALANNQTQYTIIKNLEGACDSLAFFSNTQVQQEGRATAVLPHISDSC